MSASHSHLNGFIGALADHVVIFSLVVYKVTFSQLQQAAVGKSARPNKNYGLTRPIPYCPFIVAFWSIIWVGIS